MKKRFILLAAVAALCTTFFAGCGNMQNDAQTRDSSPVQIVKSDDNGTGTETPAPSQDSDGDFESQKPEDGTDEAPRDGDFNLPPALRRLHRGKRPLPVPLPHPNHNR